MPLRRRVSIDSSHGMSDDSSEDEDTRNQNIANKLKTNRSIDQISVSKINIYLIIFFFIYGQYKFSTRKKLNVFKPMCKYLN